MKIYFGCAIGGAPDGWLGKINAFKQTLRDETGHEVMEFVDPAEGTMQDVYLNDIHYAVANCDCMIGEVSYPSLGLGWEMATAIEKLRKPVLMCAQENAKVSRLAQGAICSKNPRCSFVLYTDTVDLMKKIKEWLSTIQ